MKKTKLLLDLELKQYNLISVNKAYRFYDPKRKNKYQPYVGDKKTKENIQNQLTSKYRGKPLKINYMKVDINASKKSDIDNKAKTLLDASEGIIMLNDRDINKLLFRRAKSNKVTYHSKEKRIKIDFIDKTFDNSVNKHWKSKNIKLSKEAEIFKKDISTLSAFYKKDKKYLSKKEIIIVINTTLRSTQDLDNVFKLIFDSFTGIIYKDDKQISYIFATKTVNNKSKNNLRIRIWENLTT